MREVLKSCAKTEAEAVRPRPRVRWGEGAGVYRQVFTKQVSRVLTGHVLDNNGGTRRTGPRGRKVRLC